MADKILILGDIHGKTCWKEIIDIEQPDKVIFLGDYVGSHEDISSKQQISNLKEILDYKQNNPDNVILLRGNHDLQHLFLNKDSWYSCSYFPEVGKYLSNNKKLFLDCTQWIYRLGNIVFSHAGITKTWFSDTQCSSIDDINNLDVEEGLFGFRVGLDNIFDNSGNSIYQSCVWVRPMYLIKDMIDNYTQVVGHTTVYNIVDITRYGKLDISIPSLWLCDNLPFEYLVYEDGGFRKKSYKIPLSGDMNLYLLKHKMDKDGYLSLVDENEDFYVKNVRIIEDEEPKRKIYAIDPPGGPFLQVGGKLSGAVIKDIKYDIYRFRVLLDE